LELICYLGYLYNVNCIFGECWVLFARQDNHNHGGHMNITITPQADMAVLNEIEPILMYSLAFVLALGGVWAFALAQCGWGHIGLVQVDIWKGQVKVQCK